MRDGFQAQLLVVGAMLSMARPVTGAVLIARAEPAAEALGRAASRNPRVARVLLGFLGAADYTELGVIGFEIFVATGIDRGAVDPTSGVTATMRDVLRDLNFEMQPEHAGGVATADELPPLHGDAQPVS